MREGVATKVCLRGAMRFTVGAVASPRSVLRPRIFTARGFSITPFSVRAVLSAITIDALEECFVVLLDAVS